MLLWQFKDENVFIKLVNILNNGQKKFVTPIKVDDAVNEVNLYIHKSSRYPLQARFIVGDDSEAIEIRTQVNNSMLREDIEKILAIQWQSKF